MKVLLTGATGFLGSALTKSLVGEGHQVIITKRSLSDTGRIDSVMSELSYYDIDRCSFEDVFNDHGKIDSVIHMATCYGRKDESISDVFNANTVFPLGLLKAASVYGTDTFINTDTILPRYVNSYALSKRHFQEWGKHFAKTGNIRFVNIRLEHMYGPGDDDTKFPSHVIRSCLKNVPELKFTAGKQERDFIYIDDVVSAYSVLLKEGELKRTLYQEYDLGCGQSVTIREFVETVHRITGSTTVLKFGLLPYRKYEIMRSRINIRGLRELGWSPQVGLAQGIRHCLDAEIVR
jgi:CDP-paratose synthetase